MYNDLIKEFKAKMGKNFMTPNVLSLDSRGKRVVEVAEGTGFNDEEIFGVTVRDYKDGKFTDEESLSKPFFSRSEAEAYKKKVLEEVI